MKYGENKKVARVAIAECVTDVLTIFHVFFELLLNRRSATWNLFLLYNKEFKGVFDGDISYASGL